MEIRRAVPGDAPALARVVIDAWRSAYRGLVPDAHLDALDYDERAQRFRDSLARNTQQTYLAEEAGETFGILTLGACRDADVDQEMTGEIWGLYLAPSHWRMGHGTSLARFGEQFLKAHGYRMSTMWVFAGNQAARRFYEAMGYVPDGAARTITAGTLLEVVRYRRTLSDPESEHDCGLARSKPQSD
jgi:RimJ/RimL family protein N-acetyltransferase